MLEIQYFTNYPCNRQSHPQSAVIVIIMSPHSVPTPDACECVPLIENPWSPPVPYPSQTRALSQMRTCTNGNPNASVCVWVLVLIREYSFVVCLGSFVLFSLLLCLDSRAHWFWASAWCWETHTREYITCFPSPPTPTPTPTPADSPFAWLCLCASVCEFMHTNWKISDLWFVPAKRSVAKRRTASKTNSKITTTNRQQVTPKPAIEQRPPNRPRAEPEQTQRPTRMRLRVPKAPTTHSCRRSQRRWQQQVNVKLIKRQCTVGPSGDNKCNLIMGLEVER